MLKKKRWESGNGLGVFVTVGPVRSSGVPPHELGEERVTSLRTCAWEAIAIPMESGTFQDEAAKLFNKLPLSVRNC